MEKNFEEKEKRVLLEAQHLWKSYGEGEAKIDALADVSLKIYEGELLTILGSSGSGKSTLLNSLGAMDKPDKGSIIVDNQDICKMNDRALTDYRKKNVGFVFQSFNLISELTAEENVALTAHDAKIVKKVFEIVGLSGKTKSYPSQLSGGQQQRVSIARALAKDPKLLLCDEPTGALDYETGKQILAELEKLVRQHGRTVVIVTHTQEIGKMSDRIIKMRNGMIKSVTVNDQPVSAASIEW